MKQEQKVAHGLCEKSFLTESVRNHNKKSRMKALILLYGLMAVISVGMVLYVKFKNK